MCLIAFQIWGFTDRIFTFVFKINAGAGLEKKTSKKQY